MVSVKKTKTLIFHGCTLPSPKDQEIKNNYNLQHIQNISCGSGVRNHKVTLETFDLFIIYSFYNNCHLKYSNH